MSISHEAKMTIGWRIECEDIPEYEERQDMEWVELDYLADEASKLLEGSVWVDELCCIENEWVGDTQMVGVPMIKGELLIEGFEERTRKLVELAKEVYRQVMRKEPEDGPFLINWVWVY